MNIFKLKRNMHRLVNILFYLGFFIMGYICAKTMTGDLPHSINNMIGDVIRW